MTVNPTDHQKLKLQIEDGAENAYSTGHIEERIAQALLREGEFYESISAADLEIILRNIVYTLFAQQKVAGRDLDILHNVPVMNVTINEDEADIEFVVHIHKPIVVFVEFSYKLVNQACGDEKNLCVDESSLQIKEKTRRFDVKAKAALTALNIPRIARQEMSDMTAVIRKTLPAQLEKRGVTGELSSIKLSLREHTLCVRLQGDFSPLQPYG